MNNENKAKAIELTDEEMDKVAGGKAAIRVSVGVHLCYASGISFREFDANYYEKNKCKRFKYSDPTDDMHNEPKNCEICKHFLGSWQNYYGEHSDKWFKKRGFNIGTHE